MRSVAENFQSVRDTLSGAGISPDSIAIVGVIKKQPPAVIEQGIEAGLSLLGSNYVQETIPIRQAFSEKKIQWHFIGHIQSRKAKELVSYDCLQSLDRLSVAQSLNRILSETGKRLPVLIQINIGKEESKSGITEEELPGFLEALSHYPQLEPAGLMALPPPLNPVAARRPFFQRMRKLFEIHQSNYPFRWLSLGTSEDYLIAVQEGANMIRLGTTLFGPRS